LCDSVISSTARFKKSDCLPLPLPPLRRRHRDLKASCISTLTSKHTHTQFLHKHDTYIIPALPYFRLHFKNKTLDCPASCKLKSVNTLIFFYHKTYEFSSMNHKLSSCSPFVSSPISLISLQITYNCCSQIYHIWFSCIIHSGFKIEKNYWPHQGYQNSAKNCIKFRKNLHFTWIHVALTDTKSQLLNRNTISFHCSFC
jgi:hypothetical protein